MKWLILLSIRSYWILVPVKHRRKCIFKNSCSQYVYQEAETKGAISGFKAFVYRYKSCRPGFICYLNPITGQIEMLLLTGEVVDEGQIADSFSNELKLIK